MEAHQYKIRIGRNDEDCRAIIIPKKAVRQEDNFIVIDVDKMDGDEKSFLAGWLGGVSSWLLRKL